MTDWMGLPALASAHGGQIDSLIGWIHVFMLILFVGWSVFLGYCLVRFRASRNPVADYTGVTSHTSTYSEIGVAVVEAVLLIGFAIPLWAAKREGRRREFRCGWAVGGEVSNVPILGLMRRAVRILVIGTGYNNAMFFETFLKKSQL